MEKTKSQFKTSFKTRMLYSLTSLGICIIAEAANSGIVDFFIVDHMKLPVKWFGWFAVFYTIYNAVNNPAIGYISDRTRSRWGRRIPYVKFTYIPFILSFAFIFSIPFNGLDHPVALLVCYGSLMVIWETLYTAIATGYYGLLPEMFDSYDERTDVAAKMNIFQVLGLVIGVASPPMLSEILGWPTMAALLAVMSIIAMFIGKDALFERFGSKEQAAIPLLEALKVTYINKSFLAAATAQTMRFFSTGVLTMGMMFFLKYSLKVDESGASTILGIAFVVSALMLYPWRQLVANKTDSRRTLMIADVIMIIGVIVLGLGQSMTHAYIAAVILGIGLSGLVLNGDVITAEVVDEDQLKTGQQRAGMYFGMMGFWITLSGILYKGIFSIMMPLFGYDATLSVAAQPKAVALGFRLYMTIPSIIGFLLSILAFYMYPLNKNRLNEIKAALKEKEESSASGTSIQ
jgi:glycoside/pentoside/hexuronide:cation symporter, GPH family